MKSVSILVLVMVLVLAFASVAAAQTGTAAASAEIRDVQGRVVGNALLTQAGNGEVRVQVQVAGFNPGASQHGIHFHAVGSCTPTFDAAGPHFNPTAKKHGLNNPEGPHAGDLPNMSFNSDGTGTFDANTNLITLGQGANSIFDADGTAIVIHAGSDDQMTDPAGNSGDRIACGVLVTGRSAAGTLGQAGTATTTATAAATAAATATDAAQATPAATVQATAMATAQATPAAGAAANPTAAPPGTLPTTGGSSLLPALLAAGAALAAGAGMTRLARKK